MISIYSKSEEDLNQLTQLYNMKYPSLQVKCNWLHDSIPLTKKEFKVLKSIRDIDEHNYFNYNTLVFFDESAMVNPNYNNYTDVIDGYPKGKFFSYKTLRGFLTLLIYFTVFQIAILIGLLAYVFINDGNITENELGQSALVIQTIVSVFFIALYFVIYRKKFILHFKKLNVSFFWKIPVYYLSMYGLIIFTSIITAPIQVQSENQEAVESFLSGSTLLFSIFAIAIVPALLEEMVFRLGVIEDAAYVFKNKIIKLIISTIIFSGIHVSTELSSVSLDDPSSLLVLLGAFVGYVPIALVISYAYVREKNIYYSITLHFLNNFIAVLLMFLVY